MVGSECSPLNNMEIYNMGGMRVIYTDTEEEAESLDMAISRSQKAGVLTLQCGDAIPLALAAECHQEYESLLAGEREVDMRLGILCAFGSLGAARVPHRIDPMIPRGVPGSGLQPIRTRPSGEVIPASSRVNRDMKSGMCSCGGVSENSLPNVRCGGTAAQDSQSEANEGRCPPLPPTTC